MFYTMKQIVFLVVASMLVASIGAFALTDAVEAAKPIVKWCVEGNLAVCADTPKLCHPLLGAVADAKKCERVVTS